MHELRGHERRSYRRRRATIRLDNGCIDNALVARVVERDKTALEKLYLRHAHAILSLARRIVWDDAVAEDVVQDVFVDFWLRPSRFEARRSSLRSFLLLQTRSRSIESIRSDCARRRREDLAARQNVATLAGLDASLIRSDEHRVVRNSLELLPPREREAIALAFFGGLTYREVAEELRQPEGTIKSRIRSGLERVKPVLAELATWTP